MSPVQPEVGEVGAGAGAGGGGVATGGVGLPGGGVDLGTRRDCADVSRRGLELLGFLNPGFFSGQFAYGSIG